MIAIPQQLPDDIDALKEIISNLSKITNRYEKEIQYLEEKNNLLLQKLFGRKSEKTTPEDILQGRLFDEVESFSNPDKDKTEEEVETVTVVPSYTRKKEGGNLFLSRSRELMLFMILPEKRNNVPVDVR